MKSSVSNIQMAGFDDLFQSSNPPGAEQVQEIPLNELHLFKKPSFPGAGR